MSEQTAQEPTMEEILASIRRIISEDDAPAATAEEAGEAEPAQAEAAPAVLDEPAAVAAEPEPEPAPRIEAAPEAREEDVLELTERVETHGDIDVYVPPAPEPEPEPVVAAAPPPPEPPRVAAPASPPAAETLVSAAAASAAASAFGQLSAAIAMPRDNHTLEDVVRDMLRPLLKDWLDSNLPQIVQVAVAEEVERIARNRGRG
jgi:cell pole-organizing protein PopZ